MNENNNSKEPDQELSISSDKEIIKENVILKGWNDFVSSISEGFKKFQKSVENQSKENSELWNENKEKLVSFFTKTKELWENNLNEWNKELLDLQSESQEQWNQNKEKIDRFFKDTKQEWDNKLKKWTLDIQQKQIETKEQWEERKQKISEDLKNWQDKTRRDWEKGLKSWRKEMIKGSYMFLVFMIPILVVFFVIVWLINWLLGGLRG
ncbi:MAG: hypothetical protein ACFFA8_09910 [Promethearchaeota archaeon]